MLLSRLSVLIAFLMLVSCHDVQLAAGGDTQSVQDVPPVVEIAEEVTFEDSCFTNEYFFCPPFDEIWQVLITTNNCVDPPEVVVGDCEQLFECDPSTPVVGEQACTDGNGFPGTQQIICDKGYIKLGDCSSPCFDEICDYLDNDCDGETDEGELNACGECGDVPEEICNGYDDDCDGKTDESVFKPCSTECGDGLSLCIGGLWSLCNAPYPQQETCNGIDDDCDGLIDEDLVCGCLLGVYVPCIDSPLVCGQGFKACVCADEECSEYAMSECQNICAYINPGPDCDPYVGDITPEFCNNHDDDCNELVDDGIPNVPCYTGPPGTDGVGICHGGEHECFEGKWGYYYDDGVNQTFLIGYCDGQVLPGDADHCDGTDNDCDGVVDDGKEIVPTDILFIVDSSGSMNAEFNAVVFALSQFAINFSLEEEIRWGLVVGPTQMQSSPLETLQLVQQLDTFDAFYTAVASMPWIGQTVSKEMLLDALYLSISNLLSPSSLPYSVGDLAWQLGIDSMPSISAWSIDWDDDKDNVIIIFTDEDAQSFLVPFLMPNVVADLVSSIEDLTIYAFLNPSNGPSHWYGIVSVSGGKIYSLSPTGKDMYGNLMEVIDESICK